MRSVRLCVATVLAGTVAVAAPAGAPTPEQAAAFIDRANADLKRPWVERARQLDQGDLYHRYFNSYYRLPVLFQTGAHDGFHEAVGDTLVLSLTPRYLAREGLAGKGTGEDPQDRLNRLMLEALQRAAVLPFGRLMDEWRWQVFAAEIRPADYNTAWWQLRHRYQGIAAPRPRAAADFDPGAKYHIPANVPYIRYFLAMILQYQFHEALCRAAGQDAGLSRCSIHGSQAAGDRLHAMLALGASRPWPEALAAIGSGERMDARPLLAYFAPLRDWLEEQNRGLGCGW